MAGHHPRADSARINKAHRLMSRIARLSPADERVMGLLSRVARCLMCQNNHQGQATSVLDRWEQKIETITESLIVEEDEEEDEEEERIENEESIPRADQRTQMSEIHEILRRIEAALVANQRRVEISASAGSSQIDSDSRPEVAPSGTGDDSNEAGSVRQTTEELFLAAVSLPKTDNLAPDHGYDDRSSDTVIEDKLLTLELERADLGPSSSEATPPQPWYMLHQRITSRRGGMISSAMGFGCQMQPCGRYGTQIHCGSPF